MKKLHIDLRLSQETVDDLAAGKSVVIEDAKDRFVLIPPQEMDCDYGVHDVAEEEEEEDELKPKCPSPGCPCMGYENEGEDDFEQIKKLQDIIIAEKMQRLVNMLVEIQKRVGV
jgi:hypothetical protein